MRVKKNSSCFVGYSVLESEELTKGSDNGEARERARGFAFRRTEGEKGVA